jgi:integrase
MNTSYCCRGAASPEGATRKQRPRAPCNLLLELMSNNVAPRPVPAQESRTMYIRKYRDGWRVEVEKHGTRASFSAPTKREVQAWGIKKEAELDTFKASKGMTFAQAAVKYLATASREKAPGAADWEERRFAEMADFFGESTRLAAIDSARIGEWRDHRLTTVSGSTVLRQLNLLRNVFSTAVDEWKVLQANPVKGIRLPEHNPARHQIWTWRLIKRVLRAPRDGRVLESIRAFHIALHTGMRLNEILNARLVGKVAVLERDKGSGKASPPVKVPLARKGAALFAKYQPFTIKPDEASAMFSDLTDELLIDGLTFHDSRASALTWLSRRMDVMTLARISRHKNLKILMESYYRESAEQIAARL